MNAVLDAQQEDAGTVKWTSFGPYRIPFSSTGDQLGTFHGTVGARIEFADNTTIDDPDPQSVSFTVEPSLLVHELEPLSASCSGPVTRSLGGAAYRIRVQAVGFAPTSFTYTLATPTIGVDPVSVRHVATGVFDQVGDRGDFQFPEVPTGQASYDAVVTVQADDTTGQSYQSAFAIGVHRPLEVYYNGNVQLAEFMAPVPVSGCIPGGPTGRDATYDESEADTRTRSYDVSWDESWLMSHTVSSGTSTTVGLDQTNGVGFSTTDGNTFHWDLGTEVGTQVSSTLGLSDLVSVGMQGHINTTSGMGGAQSQMTSNSSTSSQGLSQSETTTETNAATTGHNASSGGGIAWQVSSTSTISRTFGGQIIATTYGTFYRQTLRMLRRAAIVTYNQCGAAKVVGEVDFTDWTWSPDLALASSCPPLPRSNLPAAQCIISPCSGE